MNSSFIPHPSSLILSEHPSSFPRGFVIGATGSNTGKTTISLAILAYLKQQRYKVAPFKVGPDFIDPGHHTKIAGRQSYNIDSWMLSKAYNQKLFEKKTANCDIAVVEGVMGLFDGYDGLSETGSTAQIAKWLNLPVILVVSAKGKARSAAAIVKGFETFDPELNIAGVVFSQTGSPRHYDYLKKAVEQSCTAKCLGFMPRNDSIVMPERHLGLVTAEELDVKPEVLSTLTSMVHDHIDMKALISSLEPYESKEKTPREQKDLPKADFPGIDISKKASMGESPTGKSPASDKSPTIAVAKDKAFCFYYPDNIEILKQWGARVVEFSPLGGDTLPEDVDGLYLGGGYPEIFASKLTDNKPLLNQIKSLSDKGMPIYAECGGFMFLCDQMSGMEESKAYTMSGCFDFKVQMSKKLRSLGYREITLTQDTIIGNKGDVLRGHEFHYSSLKKSQTIVDNVYHVASRAGQDISLKGYQINNTLGSYLHIHFGSNVNCAKKLVATCLTYKQAKKKP